ncbi:hypothetical protein [Collimonas sp.]|jgi:tetratricopeptide (TPR) repeat protein|uniref:hypothetical protein n=1 Tax=Collimonas sp. TaxID=1963772 RepID=UPI002C0D6398|nr:hypothetical protein [Collimonas sp.]HWX02959.1 hypothetical protein [Collimonas sp.]
MKKDLMELNENLAARLDTLVEKGNELSEDGDNTRAIPIYMEAWGLLPEPKIEWELYSSWIAGSLFNSYFDSANFDEAKQWALKTYDARHKDEVTTEGMNEVGKACYELDQLEEAYSWFKQSFDIDGRRAFSEEDPKYLKFYLDRTAERKKSGA